MARTNYSEEQYKHGYQGAYAEQDQETGFSHFELRNWDPIIGRWNTTDPYGQFWSPYLGMGNNPVLNTDPDGGYSRVGAWWRAVVTSGVSASDIYKSGDEWGFARPGDDGIYWHDFGSFGNGWGEDHFHNTDLYKALAKSGGWNSSYDPNNPSTWASGAAHSNFNDLGAILAVELAVVSGVGAVGYGLQGLRALNAARGTNISRSSLNPTHYITKSKTQMKALFNDIRANGIQESIKYVEHNGAKYIVDGHHRFYAAQKLGIQNVPVQQVKLPYAGYKSTMDLMLEPGKHPGFWKYIK